jgi:K(+)-stimulated pyrophosphate-energized sodium pump|tara:strand:- start:100 stop:2118 length:2019 start_codon:yes stop_codon:yes gene_type:complete
MNNDLILIMALIVPLIGILFALYLSFKIIKQDEGNKDIIFIGNAIKEGAMAFLSKEYRVLSIFVIIVAIIITVLLDFGKDITNYQLPKIAISYIAGAIGSAIAGFVGMSIAVRANYRTTVQAMKGLNPALRIAFNSGAVMGISVVSIGLLGITIIYLIFDSMEAAAGFGFGASTIALFARVGGGIYTKAADVGADLVGKVEAGIPEDDPRNPATIADNVGDNVGDVAGMGADLFESYVGSIIATMTLVISATFISDSKDAVVLPFFIASIGIVSSIIGTFLVRTKEGASMGSLLWSLRTGIFSAGIIVLVITLLGALTSMFPLEVFWIILTGLIAGVIIGTASEIATSYEYKYTKDLAEQAKTGAATIIIGGLGLGMISTIIPTLVIIISMAIAYMLGDFYGIALAAVGMLSTLGITLATDAYGPVADNAGGIAEQAKLPPEVRERTDALDSLGNTTAATGKGFAIGSAVLTAGALLFSYASIAGIESINLLEVKVLIGLIIGTLMPFVFSALTMQAVGAAAMDMVNEVRRQFKEIKGLMEGKAVADYAKAVEISTNGSLKAMIVPGLIAIIVPIATGLILSKEALGAMLAGSIASGFLLAIMMANSGGAWDNAKKYIESGKLGGKGSDAHSAAVVGDTVGDPFKDTSGPALNILIKLMTIISVVFAPLFIG